MGLAGGGALADIGSHALATAEYLCGPITRVMGDCVTMIGDRPDGQGGRRKVVVDDLARAFLRFENGALGSFLLSDTAACPRSWEQTSQENKAYASYSDEDCYVIAGTVGSLSVPTLRLKTYAQPQDRSWYQPFQCSTVDVSRQDPLVLQMAHFVDMIHNQVAPRVSARDGLHNLWVVEAIVKASQTQQTVRLGLHGLQMD